MGGEKCFIAAIDFFSVGSPPRGRGKATFSGRCGPGVGITPAWAGKSAATDSTTISRRDHPRVGGEKSHVPAALQDFLGSPPRGRGKGLASHVPALANRITPAWAGKSEELWLVLNNQRDHPRVGGEKSAIRWYPRSRLGSPPRGRGKVTRRNDQTRDVGITPAWAGKSFYWCIEVFPDWDHPRVGGEKHTLLLRLQQVIGSPPRGRGKD